MIFFVVHVEHQKKENVISMYGNVLLLRDSIRVRLYFIVYVETKIMFQIVY